MNSRHSPIPSHTSVVSGIGRYSSTNQTSSPYCIVFTVRPIKHLCCSFVCKDVQPIKHVHSLPPLLPQSNCPRWLLITLTRQVCHCQPFFFVKSQSPQSSVTEPNHAKHTLVLRCLKILQCQALSVRSIVGGTVAHEVFFQLQPPDWVWSETSRSLRTTYTWWRNENNIGIFSSFCSGLVVISNDRWDLEFVTCGRPG